MKSFSLKLFRVAAAIVAIFMLTCLTAEAAVQQGKAKVTKASGGAKYSTGGAWADLKVGMVLQSGAVIQSGDDPVELDLGVNGPFIRIKAGSTLSIEKLTFDSNAADTVVETQLDLKKGGVVGQVKKTSAASRYEIKTPTGVAGIRGTTYDIEANGVVKVKEGCVIVVYVDANGRIVTMEVCAGFKFVPGQPTPVQMTQAEINAIVGGGRPPTPPAGTPTVNVFVSPVR